MIHAIFLIKNLKLKTESRKNRTILRLTTGQRLMRLITVLCSLERFFLHISFIFTTFAANSKNQKNNSFGNEAYRTTVTINT